MYMYMYMYTYVHVFTSSQDERSIEATVPGCIASFYYLHHKTMRLFCDRLHSNNTMEELLKLLCVSSNDEKCHFFLNRIHQSMLNYL